MDVQVAILGKLKRDVLLHCPGNCRHIPAACTHGLKVSLRHVLVDLECELAQKGHELPKRGYRGAALEAVPTLHLEACGGAVVIGHPEPFWKWV